MRLLEKTTTLQGIFRAKQIVKWLMTNFDKIYMAAKKRVYCFSKKLRIINHKIKDKNFLNL